MLFQTSWGLDRTFLNNMAILCAVIAKFFGAIRGEVAKFFATEALDSAHVVAFWLPCVAKATGIGEEVEHLGRGQALDS